jgi:hypothetical protein
MFVLVAVHPSGVLPVLALAGETSTRHRYVLGVTHVEPSELNPHQLQTAVLRAFESPGVSEVVVRLSRRA